MAVDENVTVGTLVGTVPAATDPDGGPTASSVIISGTVNNAPVVGRPLPDQPTTGEITTAIALDFEAGGAERLLQVAVRDNAGQAGYTQLTASVTIASATGTSRMRSARSPTWRSTRTVGRDDRRRSAGGDRSGRRRLRRSALLFPPRGRRARAVGGRPLPDQRADRRDHHRGGAQLRGHRSRAPLRGRRSADNGGQAGYTELARSFAIAVRDRNEQVSLGTVAPMRSTRM